MLGNPFVKLFSTFVPSGLSYVFIGMNKNIKFKPSKPPPPSFLASAVRPLYFLHPPAVSCAFQTASPPLLACGA